MTTKPRATAVPPAISDPPSTIQQCLAASPARVVAVIGLVKNAGKTTAVNALLTMRDETLGLTSLGLDGESMDHLTGLAKPRIRPPAGTLIATTRGSVERSRCSLEVLEQLPFRTPLGNVLVGRAVGCGPIEVSGPTTLTELRATVERLLAHGARRVLVDGAINRLGSASPRVSDAVILATGGMVGESLADVVESTNASVELLTLPQVHEADRGLLAQVVAHGAEFTVIDEQGIAAPLAVPPRASSGSTIARAVASLDNATLVVRGAVTEGLLDELARLVPARSRLRVVVRDATVVIAAARAVSRCRRAGITLEVLAPLRLLAVTVNPFRLPQSYSPGPFFTAMRDAIGDRCAVFDVVNGLASTPTTGRDASAQRVW